MSGNQIIWLENICIANKILFEILNPKLLVGLLDYDTLPKVTMYIHGVSLENRPLIDYNKHVIAETVLNLLENLSDLEDQITALNTISKIRWDILSFLPPEVINLETYYSFRGESIKLSLGAEEIKKYTRVNQGYMTLLFYHKGKFKSYNEELVKKNMILI